MLSFFPDLFTYAFVVPFIFRIALGMRFFMAGISEAKSSPDSLIPTTHRNLALSISFLLIVGSILLIAGAFTQIVSLVFTAIVISSMFIKKSKPESVSLSYENLLLLCLVTLSLLFLGPGVYSFDLPL